MGKFSKVSTGFSGDRSSLAAGNYGTNRAPGLEIVSFIGAKATKDPELIRYSFLVAATDEAKTGTAFLAFNCSNTWLRDEVIALAFKMEGIPDKATLNKLLGVSIETDQDEIMARETILAETETKLRIKAAAKAEANNAPETANKIYDNMLTAVRISVGTLFRLQDWHGYDRDALLIRYAPEQLVGVTFGGKVKESDYTPPAVPGQPAPTKSVEVDVFTCKVVPERLKTYAYTVPAEEAEADKPPF